MQRRSLIDSLTAVFTKQPEQAGFHGIRLPQAQLVPMLEQKVQLQPGIGLIAFGSADFEGLAVLCHGMGVDWIDQQKGMGH